MDLVVDGDAAPADLGLRTAGEAEALAARLTGRPGSAPTRMEIRVSEVPYDIPALTTRARYRVRGHVIEGGASHPVSAFVKVVQSWALTPQFQFVPPEFRALALAQLPWRVEPTVYASSLAAALPPGLRMPAAYAILDLAPDAAAVWMADVPHGTEPWTVAEHAAAAAALGAMAASPAVAAALRPVESEIAGLSLRSYVEGRVRVRLAPLLRDDATWAHPGIDRHFGPLRRPLTDLLDRLPDLLNELDDLPTGWCHGDACTRNLLRDPDGGPLTMIDFGFVRQAPLGLDLAQLVLGEVQLGERSAGDLTQLWSSCADAYVDGVRSSRRSVEPATVIRAATIGTAIFHGVSAVPVEELDRWDTPSGETFFAARAASARFVLDLLETTRAEIRRPAPSPTPAAAG